MGLEREKTLAALLWLCPLGPALAAWECKTDPNIFSASKITATVPASSTVAHQVCLGIAKATKQQRLFNTHWALELNNPYSQRPIATCRL